jgi:hypothetical protein
VKFYYQIPEELHNQGVSAGLGPYAFHFQGAGEEVRSWQGIATLYGSHFISDSMRIVEFGALTLEKHLSSDFGLYLYFEQFRFLDRRLAINLLIGGHAVGFKSLGKFQLVTSLPQGFELVYTDAIKRGNNLTLGGFFYPPIAGNSYYNGWLRWGRIWFAEINYIAWQAESQGQSYSSESFGLSFGFPLFRYW